MSVQPDSFPTMGIKGRSAMVAFGFAALGVITGCEPPPPPPVSNLVTNAQFNVIVEGMSLADVEWALGKRLTLFSQSNTSYGDVTFGSRIYVDSFELGSCFQSVGFSFDNIGDDLKPGPFKLSYESKSEYNCEGIVK
ncbi:MAG: hypothetical protein NTX58_14780 [Actinobacteria bacterium]|nr:hypothetical protein [Actinomycetota bacterium]